MPKYSDFGLSARMAMLKKDITLTALAKQLGISTSYLSYIFKGDREGASCRKQIADILGIEDEQQQEGA